MMTPAQKLEVRRLTPLMRDLLLAASIPIGGRQLPSARILERRGFLQIAPKDEYGFHGIMLTEAGAEAVEMIRQRPRRR